MFMIYLLLYRVVNVWVLFINNSSNRLLILLRWLWWGAGTYRFSCRLQVQKLVKFMEPKVQAGCLDTKPEPEIGTSTEGKRKGKLMNKHQSLFCGGGVLLVCIANCRDIWVKSWITNMGCTQCSHLWLGGRPFAGTFSALFTSARRSCKSISHTQHWKGLDNW